MDENGPLIHHADQILEKSLNEYWKNHNSIDGSWYFLHRSLDIRSYRGNTSNVVGKLLEEKSKLPFMQFIYNSLFYHFSFLYMSCVC